MKHFLLASLTAIALFAAVVPSSAAKHWIDVTESTLVNPGFDDGTLNGWTREGVHGGRGVACGAMEFWNGTFDFHQTAKGLPQGHYRLSVSAYFRCQDNENGYQSYLNGTEDITGFLYAGSHEQKLVSVYSWSSTTNFGSGTWSPWWVEPQVWFANSMESGAEAFKRGAYLNEMEFDHEGGDLSIGLKNSNFTSNNWCMCDNFKLEYYGEVTPISHIDLTPSECSLIVGESQQLAVTIAPSNATIKKLEWLSSNTDVATVDANGVVTAVDEGEATIYAQATDGSDVSGEAIITVERNQPKAGSLVINEVMASNIDEFVSPAFNFDGWVELYNPTDKAVELSGLYFTDNAANLRQWYTPSTLGVVPAHGFKTVWFDSNNINTNQSIFKLNVSGGILIISNADGEVVAEVNYPESMDRVSYARTTDGGDTWA